MRLRTLIAAVMVATIVAPLAAHADPVCTMSGGSSDSPQIADQPNDWEGIVTGNQNGTFGDVNRASGDILAVWFDRDAKGKDHVHVKLGSLGDPTTGSDLNLILDVYFHNPKGRTDYTNPIDSSQ